MYLCNWKKELFTIPNLLSLFRLALIPGYMTIYLEAVTDADRWLAGGILALSCLTDLLDGAIARQFNMVTDLGKLLDPLADKATQLSLSLCLSLRYPILQPVMLLLIFKETIQFFTGLHFLRQGMILPGALPMGKVCTAVLFVSLTALVLFPNIPGTVVNLLAAADLTALSVSMVSYVLVFFGKINAI